MSANVKSSSSPSGRPNISRSASGITSTIDQNFVCNLVDNLILDSGPLADHQSQSSSLATPKTDNAGNNAEKEGCAKKLNDTNEDTNKFIRRHFRRNSDGDTSLHFAVRIKQSRLIHLLIDNAGQPSNLDIVNKKSFTALHIAAMTQQADVIRKLILAGANTEVATSTGYTALHFACDESDVDSVEALTKPLNDEEKNWLVGNRKELPVVPTNLEATDKDGYTALHIAATHDNVDVIKQLIGAGANINAVESRFGRIPFHMAVENNCKKVIDYFVKEHNSCLNVLTLQGMSPYEMALNVGKPLAQDLLRLGAEPIVRDPDLYKSSEESSETNSNDDDFSDESDDDLRRYDNVAFLHNFVLEP